MTQNISHPLSRTRCNLAELRSSAGFSKFVKALNETLVELRDEYESNEATEFTRGKVQMIKEILNQLAEQNIQ